MMDNNDEDQLAEPAIVPDHQPSATTTTKTSKTKRKKKKKTPQSGKDVDAAGAKPAVRAPERDVSFQDLAASASITAEHSSSRKKKPKKEESAATAARKTKRKKKTKTPQSDKDADAKPVRASLEGDVSSQDLAAAPTEHSSFRKKTPKKEEPAATAAAEQESDVARSSNKSRDATSAPNQQQRSALDEAILRAQAMKQRLNQHAQHYNEPVSPNKSVFLSPAAFAGGRDDSEGQFSDFGDMACEEAAAPNNKPNPQPQLSALDEAILRAQAMKQRLNQHRQRYNERMLPNKKQSAFLTRAAGSRDDSEGQFSDFGDGAWKEEEAAAGSGSDCKKEKLEDHQHEEEKVEDQDLWEVLSILEKNNTIQNASPATAEDSSALDYDDYSYSTNGKKGDHTDALKKNGGEAATEEVSNAMSLNPFIAFTNSKFNHGCCYSILGIMSAIGGLMMNCYCLGSCFMQRVHQVNTVTGDPIPGQERGYGFCRAKPITVSNLITDSASGTQMKTTTVSLMAG